MTDMLLYISILPLLLTNLERQNSTLEIADNIYLVLSYPFVPERNYKLKSLLILY